MKTKPNWNEAPDWATELRLYNEVYRFRGNGMVTYKDGSHHGDALSPSDWGELVECRPKPFTINAGDYIDSRKFTREECERFCEIAVECGFPMSEYTFEEEYGDYRFIGIGQINLTGGVVWFEDAYYYEDNDDYNNITTQFREFLDKEKGMSKFTKDDLKDGMRVELRDEDVYYIVGERLALVENLTEDFVLSEFNNDLTNTARDNHDIIRVTDRDGTVLFEREPEPKEMTVADIERELGYSVKVVK